MGCKITWVWAFLAAAAATAQAGHNVVVVLDNSGSMNIAMRSDPRTTKMDAAKQALLVVLEKLPSEAKVGIVLLNGNWKPDQWVYPLGPVDMPRLRQSVGRIRGQGTTPLGACMKAGADALLALRAKDRYGFYRLLIVTDGEATERPPLVDRYLPDILTRGIWVDVIGVDMAEEHSLATKVPVYRRADDPKSLEEAVAAVFAESTGDTRDADESDFEVIAAVPNEVAAAALEALASSGNHPIGQRPPLPVPETTQQQPARPGAPTPLQPGAPSGSWSVVWTVLSTCCAVGVFIILVVIVGLVAGSKRSRYR